jgi:hypothetical protein
MTKHIAWLVATVGLLCSCSGRGGDAQTNGDLRLSLRTGGVEEVEVFAIAEGANMSAWVNPTMLTTQYHLKLDIRKPALSEDEVSRLDRALARTECRPSADRPDIRTGVIFVGTGGSWVRGFYYGPHGDKGQVDDHPCDLGAGLYEWARSRLPRY